MKKFINSMWISLCLIALASCGGVDSKIDDYEAALKDNNVEKAEQIIKSIDEDKLTDEQKARIIKISTEFATDKMSDFGNMMKNASEMMDNASDMMDKGSEMADKASEILNKTSEEDNE